MSLVQSLKSGYKNLVNSNAAIGAGNDLMDGLVKKAKKMPIYGVKDNAKSAKLWAQGSEMAGHADDAAKGLDSVLGFNKKQMDYLVRKTGDTPENIAKNIADENFSAYQGIDLKAHSNIMQRKANDAENFAEAAYMNRKGSYESKMGAIGSYITGDTSAVAGAARIGGAAIGLRYLSGGTMTRNNKGEQDIAGIPFI